MKWRILPLLALPGACVAPAATPHPADVDLSPVWAALDHGDYAAARAAVEPIGWLGHHSVEGERLRQSLLVAEGRRGELAAELQEWEAQRPGDPDLAYLEARLLQNPERQEGRLAQLAQQFPGHAWIRLALAGLAQQEGRWGEARAQLQAAPDWPDAREFRRILVARQWVAENHAREALDLLESAAFAGRQREALLEYLDIAQRTGKTLAAARATAEYRLRSLPVRASLGERIDRAFERLDAELKAGGRADLDQSLALLDSFLQQAGAPSGWVSQPRYSLEPVGELVRPEAGSGGVATAWAGAGRMLIAGEAVTRGVELLLLRDVRRVRFDWPDEPVPLELVLAGSGTSTRVNSVVGGTVFHGFYLRRDFAETSAETYADEAARVDLARPFRMPESAPEHEDWLPEDYDLPARLRAARLHEPGASALRVELQQVYLHECCHLPEILSLTGARPHVGALLWPALAAFLQTGDAVGWLEERAQARALAVSPEPQWILADLVQRARTPSDSYSRPYAGLLRVLVQVAAERGLPPLARWHELDAASLRALGAEACRRKGYQPLPAAVVARLLDGFQELFPPGAEQDAD